MAVHNCESVDSSWKAGNLNFINATRVMLRKLRMCTPTNKILFCASQFSAGVFSVFMENEDMN